MKQVTVERPLYNHVCPSCVYLGTSDGVDLYFHPDDTLGVESVVARYSDEATDCRAGFEFSRPYVGIFGKVKPGVPALIEARKRAVRRGLVKKTSWAITMSLHRKKGE